MGQPDPAFLYLQEKMLKLKRRQHALQRGIFALLILVSVLLLRINSYSPLAAKAQNRVVSENCKPAAATKHTGLDVKSARPTTAMKMEKTTLPQTTPAISTGKVSNVSANLTRLQAEPINAADLLGRLNRQIKQKVPIELANIRHQNNEIQIRLPDNSFGPGSYQANIKLLNTIKSIVAPLQENVGLVQLVIEGHSDGVPLTSHSTRRVFNTNKGLSLLRANEIQGLIKKYVPGLKQITTRGTGSQARQTRSLTLYIRLSTLVAKTPYPPATLQYQTFMNIRQHVAKYKLGTVTQTGNNTVMIHFRRNCFKPGQFDLEQSVQEKVSRLIQQVTPPYHRFRFTVYGYADESPIRAGSLQKLVKTNHGLSASRAQTIATEIANLGFPLDNIATHGIGSQVRNTRSFSLELRLSS